MVRTGLAATARLPGVHGRLGAVLGHAATVRISQSLGSRAALDTRRVRIPARRSAHHHGQSGRPLGTSSPYALGCNTFRRSLGAGSIRAHSAGADRRPGADGRRRGHTAPGEPGAHRSHVPQPAPEGAGHRHLVCGVLVRCRRRARNRRSAAASFLVGFGVPHQRAGADRAVTHRGRAYPRIPQSHTSPL
ncbi:Uncharacterised protein [Mycobacteroides abscessus subsp. abscessus]|nr:Uncharacterised protein [Mycobacteroides abscessus subsp. abscessus]